MAFYQRFDSPAPSDISHPAPPFPSDATAAVSDEQREAAAPCARRHPGPLWLGLCVFVSIFVGMSPFFCSLGTLVTADAVYSPRFNLTAARYTVTGEGRSSYNVVFGNRDEFPIAKEAIVDGESQWSNATYYALTLDNGFFACDYSVYSTVTAVNSLDFGSSGDVISLTLPSCGTLRLARGAFIAYMSLFIFSFFTTGAVWNMLYGRTASTATTARHGLPTWRAAVTLTSVVLVLGIVQASAMWAFAHDAALSHPTLGGGLIAYPCMIALFAVLQAWNLNHLYWDVRKVRQVMPDANFDNFLRVAV